MNWFGQGSRILLLTDSCGFAAELAYSYGDGDGRRPSSPGESRPAHRSGSGRRGRRLSRCSPCRRTDRIRCGRGVSMASVADGAGRWQGTAGEAALLKAMQSGLAKVMSKMGISVLDSYRAAQLFDILGLDAPVVDRCFAGSLSPLGGWGFAEIEAAVRASWAAETWQLPSCPTMVGFAFAAMIVQNLIFGSRKGRVIFSSPLARPGGATQAAATAPAPAEAWSAYKAASRRSRAAGFARSAGGSSRPARHCRLIMSRNPPAWCVASCPVRCRWVR